MDLLSGARRLYPVRWSASEFFHALVKLREHLEHLECRLCSE